jgi:hypothetical protein
MFKKLKLLLTTIVFLVCMSLHQTVFIYSPMSSSLPIFIRNLQLSTRVILNLPFYEILPLFSLTTKGQWFVVPLQQPNFKSCSIQQHLVHDVCYFSCLVALARNFSIILNRKPDTPLGTGGSCAWNPSYSGGRDQEDRSLKSALANSSRDPILKNSSQK